MPPGRKKRRIEEDDDDQVHVDDDQQLNADEDALWGDDDDQEKEKPEKAKKELIADILASDDESVSGESSDGERHADLDDDELASDGYDSDLMGDDADRAHLASLPAVEREQILYDRGEARRELEERRRAQEELRAARGQQRKSSKRQAKKAPSKRRVGEKRSVSEALADMLARKASKSKVSDSLTYEEESEDDEQLEDAAAARKRRNRQKKRHSQHREYESDDEQDDGEQVQEEADKQPGKPVTFQHIKHLQLRRLALEKIFEEPYFASVVVGMYVRVSIGARPDGTPAYRLCEIAAVAEFKAKYKFGTQARETKTGLLLKFGKAERIFSMIQVSNQSITPDEYDKWLKQMESDGLEVPTQEEATRRKKHIETVRQTFTYTPDVIAKAVAEKRAKGFKQGLKHANLTAERNRLVNEIQHARDAGDEELLKQLTVKMEELEELEAKHRASTSHSSVHGILQINERNRAMNEAHMAAMARHLEEEKRQLAELEAELRKKGIVKTDSVVKRDAFKRKETRPNMNFQNDAELEAERVKKEQAEKKKKEEEAAKKAAADKERQAAQNKNKLEDFSDLAPLANVSLDANSSTPGEAHIRTLLLPHVLSPSEQLLQQLQHCYNNAKLPVIEQSALHNPMALGHVLTGELQPFVKYLSTPLHDDLWTYQPKPGEQTLTVQEYFARREQG